jgi:AraC family transcriptional regulator
MTEQFKRVQPALAFVAGHLDDDLALTKVAGHAGLSSFHLHRMFSAVAGETPKQLVRRLRLNRGAAMLLGRDQSVLTVALSSGFQSHEGFTRAFRRQFGMSPWDYRERGFAGGRPNAAEAAAHATLVEQIGPCIGLFHVRTEEMNRRNDVSYSIVRKDLAEQPVLLVRRRVKRSEIAATIGAVLPSIFQYAQAHGIALSGHPFTRYSASGLGLMTIEPGMRIVGPRPSDASASASGGQSASATHEVIVDVLPAGPAVTTVHSGPYETLQDAYAALEAWMESNAVEPAGAPWESYITDPAEHPDPRDWRTEVSWPIR